MKQGGIIQISEREKLKIALSRNYEERFELLMKLIRIDSMLKNAKIIYPNKDSKRI